MVVAYGFNLHHSFGGTQKDSISAINSKEPLNLTLKESSSFFCFVFWLSLIIVLPEKFTRSCDPSLALFGVQVCCGGKIKRRIEIITSLVLLDLELV